MTNHDQVSIKVTCRHGRVSTRMEEYATRKASRLLRFNDQISRIEIVVDGPHEAPDLEMVVHIDNREHLFAKEKRDHFKPAMDRLADKMERQLVRAKEKLKHHKGDGRGHKEDGGADEPVAKRPDEPEDTYEDVVRRDLKP